jgi:argininosuccinate synthase
MDRNLLHISYEAGILEDPWFDAFSPKNKAMFRLSVDPEDAPARPEYVTLDFERGNCVGVNGRSLGPLGGVAGVEPVGWEARCGAGGPGREPVRGNEIAGCL